MSWHMSFSAAMACTLTLSIYLLAYLGKYPFRDLIIKGCNHTCLYQSHILKSSSGYLYSHSIQTMYFLQIMNIPYKEVLYCMRLKAFLLLYTN